jgi:hypothetical protein
MPPTFIWTVLFVGSVVTRALLLKKYEALRGRHYRTSFNWL